MSMTTISPCCSVRLLWLWWGLAPFSADPTMMKSTLWCSLRMSFSSSSAMWFSVFPACSIFGTWLSTLSIACAALRRAVISASSLWMNSSARMVVARVVSQFLPRRCWSCSRWSAVMSGLMATWVGCGGRAAMAMSCGFSPSIQPVMVMFSLGMGVSVRSPRSTAGRMNVG